MSREQAKRLLILVGASAFFGIYVFVLGTYAREIKNNNDDQKVSGDFNKGGTSTLSSYKIVLNKTEKIEGGIEAEEGRYAEKARELSETSRVLLSSPLKIFTKNKEVEILPNDVIGLTNLERINADKEPLEINAELTKSAEMKVADMFENQYFDHINKDGHGPDYFVKNAHYEYVSVGENLAFGNFGSTEDLIKAWMESPGHRDNILRKQFSEIGIAVGTGIFEGKRVTIAVQHFGRPISSCPNVDQKLKAEIDQGILELGKLENKINQDKQKIDKLEKMLADYKSGKTDHFDKDSYENAINKYNTMVDNYNILVKRTKNNTAEYNTFIRAFNDCLKVQ